MCPPVSGRFLEALAVSRFLWRRLAWSVFVAWGVTLLAFVISHLIPADPAKIAAGLNASPDVIENVRHQLGLDRPVYEQYITYTTGLLRGDLGRSITSTRPVLADLADYFPATLELTLWTTLFIAVLGISMGIAAALYRGTWVDIGTNVFGSLWVALPIFWIGIVFQFFLYLKLGWFPIGDRLSSTTPAPYHITGMYTLDALLTGNMPALGDVLRHLFLPVITLGLHNTAIVARMTRASLLDVLNQDYIRTAKAKGLAHRSVVLVHALKNAAIPVATVLGGQFRFLLGGALLIESIFQWPGLGMYATRAILFVDYPAIMGVTLTAALVTLVVNLLVDLIYVAIDPRIRYS